MFCVIMNSLAVTEASDAAGLHATFYGPVVLAEPSGSTEPPKTVTDLLEFQTR